MPWVKQLEVPHRLCAIVRARESSIIVLVLLAGALAGLVIAAMGAVVLMHVIFFGLDPGERLSAQVSLNSLYVFFTPCIGGLLFGLATAYVTRRRGTEVDPIEANALHGGSMSMRGSLIVAAQTARVAPLFRCLGTSAVGCSAKCVALRSAPVLARLRDSDAEKSGRAG